MIGGNKFETKESAAPCSPRFQLVGHLDSLRCMKLKSDLWDYHECNVLFCLDNVTVFNPYCITEYIMCVIEYKVYNIIVYIGYNNIQIIRLIWIIIILYTNCNTMCTWQIKFFHLDSTMRKQCFNYVMKEKSSWGYVLDSSDKNKWSIFSIANPIGLDSQCQRYHHPQVIPSKNDISSHARPCRVSDWQSQYEKTFLNLDGTCTQYLIVDFQANKCCPRWNNSYANSNKCEWTFIIRGGPPKNPPL